MSNCGDAVLSFPEGSVTIPLSDDGVKGAGFLVEREPGYKMGGVYLQVCYTFKKGDRDPVLHPILRSAFLPLYMEYTCLLAGDLSVSRHTTRESRGWRGGEGSWATSPPTPEASTRLFSVSWVCYLV